MEPQRAHLVFACGSALYAVPSELATEVLAKPQLTRIPAGPEHQLGLFAHRGEVIPVMDLARLLGGGAVDGPRLVLLRLPAGALAFTALSVAGIAQLVGEAAPQAGFGWGRFLIGPLHSRYGEVTLLDVLALSAELVRSAGARAG